MSDQSFFLILSNPRTGSTWLETSLGELPDVAVNHEIKWGPAMDYNAAGIQRILSGPGDSCRRLMNDISATSPIIGSKLLLDGKQFPRDQVTDLVAAVDDDIRIIHLTRNYFDILLSVRGHGAVHTFARLPSGEKNAEIVKTLQSSCSSKFDAIAHKMASQIVDDALSYKLLNLRYRLLGSYPVNYLHYDDIIGLLIILFINDLILLQIRRNTRPWMHMRYETAVHDFPALVTFIGSRASAQEVQHIIEQPITRKLSKIRPDIFRNHQALQTVAALLDHARDTAFVDGAAISDYWHWDTTTSEIHIFVNGLAQAVEAGRPIYQRRRVNANAPLQWTFV